MIVSDADAILRLNSPLNLINKLKTHVSKDKKDAMELFTGPPQKVVMSSVNDLSVAANAGEPHPAENMQINLDTILANNESQIKLGLAHDKSLGLLSRAVDMLDAKLDEVSASKLPATIIAASKVVESIRKERLESLRTQKDREVHYHFYTPDQRKLQDYEVIEVQ
jgi:hypothetical protein